MNITRITSITYHHSLPPSPSTGELYIVASQKLHALELPRLPRAKSRYYLREYAGQTLGEESLRKVVMLPEGENLDKWLAVHGTQS